MGTLGRAALIGVVGLTVLVGAGAAAQAAAPGPVRPPAIRGGTKQGDILAASTGTFRGSGLGYSYQWRRCDSSGGACVDIAGATDSIYTLGASDAGTTLRVVVTATNSGGSATQISAATAPVTGPPAAAPKNVTPPAVTGTPRAGSKVVAAAGTWAAAHELLYSWRRCDRLGGNCAFVTGFSHSSSYTAGNADVGHALRALVAGRTGGARSYALSAPTAAVAAAPPAAPVPPHNDRAPSIVGNPEEGSTLTADEGRWSGNKLTFSYLWRRCDTNGNNCANIGGATARRYGLTSADVGHTVRVVVTATNGAGTATAVSAQTKTITSLSAAAPHTSSVPRITGTPVDGNVLTAQPNSWSGAAPIRISFRWRRCDAPGANCVDTGITSDTYQLSSVDVGHTMRVVVSAANRAGSASALSDPSPVVQPKTPAPTGCASVATVSLPEQLLIDRTEYTPSRITSRSAPLVARFHVTTTKGRCVSGALVYAVGVPFDRLSKAPEVVSGSDGWATVTFQILPTFQLKHGNLVVIFVRGRKPGDSLLAGVSTRRLVSIRVG